MISSDNIKLGSINQRHHLVQICNAVFLPFWQFLFSPIKKEETAIKASVSKFILSSTSARYQVCTTNRSVNYQVKKTAA